MPDTTQDAGKALVRRLRQTDNFDLNVYLNQAQVEVLLAYITALEEIRDFHANEIEERNG